MLKPLGTFAVAATALLTACSDAPPVVVQDMTGWVPQAALDSVRADNHRLVNDLAYATFRLEQCQGPNADLNRAAYHLERGEHTQAKELLEKAKQGGGANAKKAAELEKRMNTTSTTKVAMTTKDDDLVSENNDGVTWYYDRRVPRTLDTTVVYLYMGHRETGAPWLRMRMQYSGDHWLYVHTIRLSAGRNVFERHPDPTLMFSHASDLTVTEWNDTPPSTEDLRIIREIIGSPDAEVTFIGARGQYSRKLSDVEREAFIHVLNVEGAMGRAEQAKVM